MSEGTSKQVAAPSVAPLVNTGDAWGDLISETRQRELAARLEQWAAETDHGTRRGPFSVDLTTAGYKEMESARLTGADVFWLAAHLLTGETGDFQAVGAQLRLSGIRTRVLFQLAGLHLEGANLQGAHLEGAILRSAHLEYASLTSASVDLADLRGTHLDHADLRRASLNRVDAEKATLADADLRYATAQNADLRRANLHGAKLAEAHLESADFFGADLGEANMRGTLLHDTNVTEARMNGALLQRATGVSMHLRGADLTGANLTDATLTLADFSEANLENAQLGRAQLDGADFNRARLLGTDCTEACMERCHLQGARLEGATLRGVRLGRTDLRLAVFDEETDLYGAVMRDDRGIGPWIAETRWGGAKLAVARWNHVIMTMDEACVEEPDTPAESDAVAATRQERLEAAVRANRQLALALQQEGLEEEAIYFTGRTQRLQRALYLSRGQRNQYISSLTLDGLANALAGYGYRPLRAFGVYIGTVLLFGAIYFLIGHLIEPRLSVLGALVFSVTSFHGRGFFPSPDHANLDHPLVVFAAFEAVIGLIIEVTFIAVFTKRFFFGH